MALSFTKVLFNVPNTMSVFRVLTAPLLALFWLGLDWRIAALALGIVSGLTDQLDGYAARKLNQTTELGALIDQLGDLVFESICLLIGVLSGYLWSGLLIIYLFREFVVTVVRSYVIGHGGSLPSTMLGKVKSSCIQWAFIHIFLGGIFLMPGRIPSTMNLAGFSPGQLNVWFLMDCSGPGDGPHFRGDLFQGVHSLLCRTATIQPRPPAQLNTLPRTPTDPTNRGDLKETPRCSSSLSFSPEGPHG
jgi:CDP-diacylglycerol--glycerol-3-phosphate 3-phosphatidyltransferase